MWSRYPVAQWCTVAPNITCRVRVRAINEWLSVRLQTVVLQYYEEMADKMHEVVGSLNGYIERRDIDKLQLEYLHRY